MSEIYTSLNLSPKKKRSRSQRDNVTLSPKKMRLAPPSPPLNVTRKSAPHAEESSLPRHLSRLLDFHVALQRALSHALASSSMSPAADTGILRNVLTHISLAGYTSMSQFGIEALQQLCWIWEWDGKSLGSSLASEDTEEENPFLTTSSPSQSKDWTRGGMSFVLSPGSHFSKVDQKRVSAYGVGVKVETSDDHMSGRVAAIARWTSNAASRDNQFQAKLIRWVELNSDVSPVPEIPLANLVRLASPPKPRLLANGSSKNASSSTGSSSLPSPFKTPGKRNLNESAIPFPATPSSRSASPTKNTILFPQTPSSRHVSSLPTSGLPTPRTPSTSSVSQSERPQTPSTPRGSKTPQTPSTVRRQALYERVRQKSLTASPTKSLGTIGGASMTRDQLLKCSQDEMRRRCLLGRLGGVADGVWMLFSTPASTDNASSTSRKRKALPLLDVVDAVVKSSPVPLSTAEAKESLQMLTTLCPFFLTSLDIAGEDWLQMPASSTCIISDVDVEASPSKTGRGVKDSSEDIVTRSPRRVKREAGGLREVREIIRRELDGQD